MRVIAGSARRINLRTLEGLETRPTTDRIKETLFNMINPFIGGIYFLDLFAGSGQIGIEALSRGARNAVFVEQNKEAIKCIEENLEKTRLQDNAKVMNSDVISALRKLEGKYTFEYIFMDPPYGKNLEKEALNYLKDSMLVNDETVIIIESDLKTTFDYLDEMGFDIIKRKEYKTNCHMFIEKRNL